MELELESKEKLISDSQSSLHENAGRIPIHLCGIDTALVLAYFFAFSNAFFGGGDWKTEKVRKLHKGRIEEMKRGTRERKKGMSFRHSFVRSVVGAEFECAHRVFLFSRRRRLRPQQTFENWGLRRYNDGLPRSRSRNIC